MWMKKTSSYSLALSLVLAWFASFVCCSPNPRESSKDARDKGWQDFSKGNSPLNSRLQSQISTCQPKLQNNENSVSDPSKRNPQLYVFQYPAGDGTHSWHAFFFFVHKFSFPLYIFLPFSLIHRIKKKKITKAIPTATNEICRKIGDTYIHK